MYERPREELEPAENNFTPLLRELLANREGPDAYLRYHAARALFETAASPHAPEQMLKLQEAIDEAEGSMSDDTREVLDQIILWTEDPRGDFMAALAATIEDLDSPDLELNTNAIQLAHSINAWELAGSINYVRDAGIDTRHHSKNDWLDMMQEARNFVAFRNARVLRAYGMPEQRTLPPTIARFILENLDLDGFTGRPEEQGKR